MIDIHCHLLPGLDDGAQSMEEAIVMAEAAVRDGIETVIATPHHANRKYDNEAAQVIPAVGRLNQELGKRQIPLTVAAGQEIHVRFDLLDRAERGELLGLADSPYMLLELPDDRVPREFSEWIHELRLIGVTPVIAHPERNIEIIRNPELLAEWVRLGALSQVTSHAVTGRFGSRMQKVTLDLCRRNLVHFCASDAHNTRNRPFALREAYEVIRDRVGAEYVDYYQGNARRIVESTVPIERWEPQEKRPWWRFGRG